MVDESVPSKLARGDEESLWWAAEFRRFGMVEAQAARLAFQAGLDRHAVRAALERGCQPDLAFLIYS